jgi:hypothetical protein
VDDLPQWIEELQSVAPRSSANGAAINAARRRFRHLTHFVEHGTYYDRSPVSDRELAAFRHELALWEDVRSIEVVLRSARYLEWIGKKGQHNLLALISRLDVETKRHDCPTCTCA